MPAKKAHGIRGQAPFLKVAERFARRLREELDGQIQAIVLYGSVARGEMTDRSDIDVMAFVKQTSEALQNDNPRLHPFFEMRRGCPRGQWWEPAPTP